MSREAVTTAGSRDRRAHVHAQRTSCWARTGAVLPTVTRSMVLGAGRLIGDEAVARDSHCDVETLSLALCRRVTAPGPARYLITP
jgi:hypothetical protein